jgi:hypothetical protein
MGGDIPSESAFERKFVIGQVVPANPAASVRGPRHVVRVGQTLVLHPAQARLLLDGIDASTPAAPRDRTLISLMIYTFARIGAALCMQVEDVFTQNRRLWVRLHEKGGKDHAMPCHHNLEEVLEAYVDGTGITGNLKGPLFRTIGRGTGRLTRTALPQANAYAMIRRRARGGRHQDQDWEPQLPRNGDHRVPEEWWHSGVGRIHGQPREYPYHSALRSPLRPLMIGRRAPYPYTGIANNTLWLHVWRFFNVESGCTTPSPVRVHFCSLTAP